MRKDFRLDLTKFSREQLWKKLKDKTCEEKVLNVCGKPADYHITHKEKHVAYLCEECYKLRWPISKT